MAFDDDLAQRIRAVLRRRPGVSEKKMFGGLGFMIDGRMAVAASSRGGVMLRVDPADTDDCLADPAVEPMQMRGTPIRGWIRVDTTGMSDAVFRGWIDRGVSFARSLPPS